MVITDLLPTVRKTLAKVTVRLEVHDLSSTQPCPVRMRILDLMLRVERVSRSLHVKIPYNSFSGPQRWHVTRLNFCPYSIYPHFPWQFRFSRLATQLTGPTCYFVLILNINETFETGPKTNQSLFVYPIFCNL